MLDGGVFTDACEETDDDLASMLAMKLKARKSTLLPHNTHELEKTVEATATAISQHYEAIGKPFHGVSIEELKKGYFRVNEAGVGISCVLEEKPEEEKTVANFEYADKVEIEEPMSVTTSVKVTASGRISNVDSLMQEFSDAGVPFPQTEVDWQGEAFGAKLAQVTPSKKRQSSPGVATNEVSPFLSRSSSNLSLALRKKLKKADSNPSSPKKKATSSSADLAK